MPQPKNIASLQDCIELWHRAIESKGLRVKCGEAKSAIALRWRMYTARRRDQQLAERTRPPSDPLWGKSAFDAFTMEVKDGDLLIVPASMVRFETEPLS